jgi:hypothetical protein
VWNPWRLVALDRTPATLVASAGVTLAGLTAARALGVRSAWLRVAGGVVGGLGAVACVMIIAAITLLIPYATAWGGVLEHQTVRLDSDISVVRRVWSTGALKACVDFEVRSGRGVWTRHGVRTECASITYTGRQDYLLSADSGRLIIARVGGMICTYTVDAAALRLKAESADECASLGIS